MELENQVVSLEYAKQLKELGFPQDSLFYFMRAGNDWLLCFKHNMGYQMTNGMVIRKEVFESNEHYSAYTIAELGEILYVVFEKNSWDLLYKAYGEVCNFKGTQWIGEIGIVNLMRSPNMAAEILIYLKENNLI